MYRFFVFATLVAFALPLPAFFATPSGYDRSESVLTPNSGGNVVWDTATGASDFYFWKDSGFRRFDVGTNTPVTTAMIGLPTGYFYFDGAVQNPANPDQFFVSFSDFSNSAMFLFTRTGPDSATETLMLPYNVTGQQIWVYDMRFIPDNPSVPANLRGKLVATGSDASGGFGGPSEVYLIDTTTLAYTRLADVGTTDGSGPIAVTSSGDVITVIPPAYPDLNGAAFVQFNASNLSSAVGGTPVAAANASVLFASSLNITNPGSLACRTESGQEVLYWSSSGHGSLYRADLASLQIDLFMEGFGPFTGTSSGQYYGGSGIAFKTRTADFTPFGGGTEPLAVTFSVSSSTTFSNIYASVSVVTPSAVNVAVSALGIVEAPSDIHSGKAFAITVEALNTGGTPIMSDVAATVSLSTGGGALLGVYTRTGPGTRVVFDDLVYDNANATETIVLTVTLAGAPSVSVNTGGIDVVRGLASIELFNKPNNIGQNVFFKVTARLRDSNGGLVKDGPDASSSIELVQISGPGTISGSLAGAADKGLLELSGLRADKQGKYRMELRNSDGSVTKSFEMNVVEQSDDSDSNSCHASSAGTGALWALLLLGFVAAPFLRRRRA